MRIEDLLRFKMVSDPQISRDGKQVLFVLNTVDRKRDSYQDHLCVVPAKGGKVTQLTKKNVRNQSPRWSPDGERVLFVAGDDGQKMTKLCVMDLGSRRTSTLCVMPNMVEKPSWSPDGKKVLFLSRIRVDEEQINHKSDVKIVKHLWYKFTTTGWFHDTRKHVFVVGARRGEPRQVTTGEFDVAAASWMPNGEDVAFVANLTDRTDSSIYKDVWITASSSKGGRRRVTKGRWQMDAVSAMPKGSSILFVGREIPDESLIIQKKSNIFAVRRGDGEPANLTKNFDQWVVPFHSCVPGWADNPKFATDTSEVYFMAYEKGSLHVFKVGLEGGRVQRVTSGPRTVVSFTVSNDGAVAYVSTDSNHAPEVWTKDGAGDRRRTNLNGRIVNGSNFSEPEEFWFTTSDRKSVQGWMIKPLKFVAGRKYPSLLSIHGGPYWAYGYGLTEVEHEFQVLAAAGFAVFYTNPRGSLGYGEEFTADISPNWAERDYADIDESVDYVLEKFPFVDKDRLGVFGGSYGGYMPNWAIGHTNRYKAALTDRRVSNIYSCAGVFDLAGSQWPPMPDIGRG